jgi:hypothetical protein
MKKRSFKLKNSRKNLLIILVLAGTLVLLNSLLLMHQSRRKNDGQQSAVDWVSIIKVSHQKLVTGGTFYTEAVGKPDFAVNHTFLNLFYKNPDGNVIPIISDIRDSKYLTISPDGQRAAVLKGDQKSDSKFVSRIYFADSATDELYSIEKYGDYNSINSYDFLSSQPWVSDYFVYYGSYKSDLYSFNIKSKQNTRLVHLTISAEETSRNYFTPYTLKAAVLDQRVVYILSRETFYKSTVHERKGEHAYVTAVDPSGKSKHLLALQDSLTSIDFMTCNYKPSPCIELKQYKNGSYGGSPYNTTYKAYKDNKISNVSASSITNTQAN